MMSLEKGGARGGVAAAGGGGLDPSNLHLKKELTQIRKAARVLRDPGTSSSWRSPLNSARSLTKHHYVQHHKNDGNPISSSSQQFLELPLQIQSSTNNYNNATTDNKGNVNLKEKEKEKRVFLYNWRSQKSESEKSKQIDVDNNSKDDGSFSSVDDEDSMSDARNGGGSDAYNAIFKCKDTDFTPSIRRAVKKKPKRSNNSNSSLRHHNEKLQKQIILSRCAKNILGREDLVSLVDQSDDTEDYCNSEDFRRASAISPLLARIKNKANWARKNHRKEDDSISYSTPALSTSSYNKYGIKNPSTVGSWDATTASFNDADDEVDDEHLDFAGQKGCGIPCYWSKRSSPSLSDTLRRKGSTFFCGTHQRKRLSSRVVGQSLVPLLPSNGRSGSSDDEISTNLGELDLEALSRLDGRRWSSSCRSQDGLELVALNGEEVNKEGSSSSSPENVRSLSYKYRPMFFEELIGQNLVIQSLVNALSRKRVAPVYLFHGPRGTGKTSTARIFAASLNCLASQESSKPCGVCRECGDFISGKNNYLREVDGSNKKGSEKFRYLLKTLLSVNPSAFSSQFKVFVVDECHLLPSTTWLMFLRLLEKPLPHVVFVLITSDVENVPRTILSRCQKHVFNKISSVEIVGRLRKIANDENLDFEIDALEMIASNADGSLRDAETMIDQLSLFGKRITITLVNELIGVVSDEKLLELLELAMSSNATETVIRARELMDSGVDPIVLMSQMATLIVDIIGGTHSKHGSFFGGRSLSERELDRLKHALSLLSEAEKHLRASSERSTWFTATLLQLGSMPSPDRTHSGSSRRQSTKTNEDDSVILLREANVHKQRADSQLLPERPASPSKSFARSDHRNSASKDSNQKQSQSLIDGGRTALRCTNSKMLNNIWLQCIEKCHSKTLRQLLNAHGRLLSISEVKGGCVAHIGFGERNIKSRAEGFLSSITNSFEIILQRNVEVKIVLIPDKAQMELFDSIAGNADTNTSKEGKSEIPVKRIESIIHEQRLETAWLQAMEKSTAAGSMRPERNQVLPQDGNYPPHELESMNSVDAPYDELNHEIKALKIDDRVMEASKKEQVAKRADHWPISPSLLHNSIFTTNFSKDNTGYESGTGAAGCSGLFCWNNTSRPQRRGKAKQGTPLRARRFSWFGECAKSRRRDNRLNR